MKNAEEELIQEIKQQVQQLWNTIKEAEKTNLKVDVDLSTTYRTVPEITIVKCLFTNKESKYQSA